MYCSTISEVINPDLGIIAFADNHIIVKEFDCNLLAEEMQTKHILITNLASIKSWMNSVRLKMDNAKSEFILFGNTILVSKCISSEVNINGEAVGRSHEIKYLGTWLDGELMLKTCVKRKCAISMTNLQIIKNIRKYLMVESSAKLAISLCLSYLDYSNSILAGLPNCTIRKMQRIQNSAAKLCSKAPALASHQVQDKIQNTCISL